MKVTTRVTPIEKGQRQLIFVKSDDGTYGLMDVASKKTLVDKITIQELQDLLSRSLVTNRPMGKEEGMALETLKGVTEINGEKIVVMDELREQYPERFTETGAMDHKWFEETIRPNSFIYVRHDKNSLSFTIQNGPIKEAGKNGCQVEDVVAVAKHIVEQLNAKFPCRENAMMITKLDEALMWSKQRTANRMARQVEGQSKA